MFTQAAPALINSLRQSGGPWPMVQALGNCNAPLTHRGAVNFAPAPRRTRDGVYGPGAWNPAQYPGLIPSAGSGGSVDIGGMTTVWNAGNVYDSQFFFPTENYFATNQFFGGPVFNVQNHAHIDYLSNDVIEGDTVNVQNVATEVINGQKVPGIAGPAGAPGRDGRPGAPGGAFFFGGIPQGRFAFLQYLFGQNPRVQFKPEPVAKPHTYVSDAWVRPTTSVSVPTNAISGGTVSITPTATSATIPTGVTFDPDTCAVSFTGYTTIYFANTATITASVSGTAAGAVTISAVAATEAGSTLASAVPANHGVLIQLKERETPKVIVGRDPRLVNVNQGRASLLHQ